MTYYNTTNESGETLERYNVEAKHQNECVVWVFRQAAKQEVYQLSASQVLERYPDFYTDSLEDGKRRKVKDAKPLITSIRRSCSTLCLVDVLEKTDDKILGPHERNEYQYKLKKDPGLHFSITKDKTGSMVIRKNSKIKVH